MQKSIKNKGITLIALVITIIVLLILAGVSISMLTGENGVLTKATESKNETEKASVKEAIELMSTEYNGEKFTGENGNIKKFFQKKVSKGEASRIVDNGDGTYTIEKDGYEVVIDENGKVQNINKKEEVSVTEVWYKIEGTTLHFSNSDLGGYLKHDESLSKPEWAGSYSEESQITKVVFDNKIAPTSTANYFFVYGNLKEIENIDFLDTSNVTDMNNMFNNCYSLTELNLSSFDTGNVTNMNMMFYNCSALTELDVSSLNTSNVTSMTGMFYNCKGLTKLNLTGLNTANVTSMGQMFKSCISLAELDLSPLNTRNVKTMSAMFQNCTKIKKINLVGIDTNNVTDMSAMFESCTCLEEIDLSSIDTSNLIYIGRMFYRCISLRELDLSSFNTKKIKKYDGRYMLSGVKCSVYVGKNWTFTENDVYYSGKFIVK